MRFKRNKPQAEKEALEVLPCFENYYNGQLDDKQRRERLLSEIVGDIACAIRELENFPERGYHWEISHIVRLLEKSRRNCEKLY